MNPKSNLNLLARVALLQILIAIFMILSRVLQFLLLLLVSITCYITIKLQVTFTGRYTGMKIQKGQISLKTTAVTYSYCESKIKAFKKRQL